MNSAIDLVALKVWHDRKDAMQSRAAELAAGGQSQGAIEEALRRDCPGMRGDNDYSQAAERAVGSLLGETLQAIEHRRNAVARLIQEGKPLEWADRDAPPAQPTHADLADSAVGNGEPDAAAVASCADAFSIIALAARHKITFRYDVPTGLIRTSKKIVKGGPLHAAVGRLRPAMVKALMDAASPEPAAMPKGLYE